MLRRYHITDGAKTTAGGVVSTANQFWKTNGYALALDGDPIDCPGCKSKGRIKCVGPRVPSSLDGKQYALSDDLCICNCDPPPKLIAIQEHMFQTVEESASDIGRRVADHIAFSDASIGTYDVAFELKDPAGRPLCGYPYTIELADGSSLEGATDRDGITRRVAAMRAVDATVTIYAPEASAVDPNWDR